MDLANICAICENLAPTTIETSPFSVTRKVLCGIPFRKLQSSALRGCVLCIICQSIMMSGADKLLGTGSHIDIRMRIDHPVELLVRHSEKFSGTTSISLSGTKGKIWLHKMGPVVVLE